jgi:hypothetical protein
VKEICTKMSGNSTATESEEESGTESSVEVIDLSDDDEDTVIDVEDSDEEDEDYWPVAIYAEALAGYNEPRGKNCLKMYP